MRKMQRLGSKLVLSSELQPCPLLFCVECFSAEIRLEMLGKCSLLHEKGPPLSAPHVPTIDALLGTDLHRNSKNADACATLTAFGMREEKETEACLSE